MKKIFLLGCISLISVWAWAQEPKVLAGNMVPISAGPASLTQKEQKKHFKMRMKQIRKLKKAYDKASAQQKPVIKQQLFNLVSEATEESRAWAQAYIASEKAHLSRWEKHLQKEGEDLEQIKAQRVDDILSGEAEMRHKLAQKRWKKEMKDRKKLMK